MKTIDIVAAIDIGSAHIIAALAEISPEGKITPLAFAETPSRGVKGGAITNIVLAQHAVDTVLEALQIDGSYHIHSIIASLSGISIIGHNVEGITEVHGSVITEHNVQQAVAAAKEVALMEGRQLLHILRQGFAVDRQSEIDEPIGLMGESLNVQVHIISVAKTAYYNLLQVFSHRDIDVDYVIAGGLASALAVTTHHEKQLGVCVLDIGAGTTDISIIHNGVIKHTEVIQLGGEHITGDIAFFMRSTIENAEVIKHQINLNTVYAPGETFEASGLSEVARTYTKQDVAEVVRERCEQLIGIIMQQIKHAGVEEAFPCGFIICGGSANLTGLDQLIMRCTQLPVRLAKVEISLPETSKRSSHFATIMGLFHCAYEEDYTRTMTEGGKTGIIARLSARFQKILRKLAQQF